MCNLELEIFERERHRLADFSRRSVILAWMSMTTIDESEPMRAPASPTSAT